MAENPISTSPPRTLTFFIPLLPYEKTLINELRDYINADISLPHETISRTYDSHIFINWSWFEVLSKALWDRKARLESIIKLQKCASPDYKLGYADRTRLLYEANKDVLNNLRSDEELEISLAPPDDEVGFWTTLQIALAICEARRYSQRLGQFRSFVIWKAVRYLFVGISRPFSDSGMEISSSDPVLTEVKSSFLLLYTPQIAWEELAEIPSSAVLEAGIVFDSHSVDLWDTWFVWKPRLPVLERNHQLFTDEQVYAYCVDQHWDFPHYRLGDVVLFNAMKVENAQEIWDKKTSESYYGQFWVCIFCSVSWKIELNGIQSDCGITHDEEAGNFLLQTVPGMLFRGVRFEERESGAEEYFWSGRVFQDLGCRTLEKDLGG